MDSERKTLILSEGIPLNVSHIPSGYFLVGTDNVHFHLSSYYISIHQVTIKQIKCFIDANGYDDQRW
jgi:hypothetical protein